MPDHSFPFHHDSSGLDKAPVGQVFAFLDDPKALAAHMSESSMMMMGSRMSIDVDADGGRVVGSKVRMDGRVLGIPLSLEEAITERQVPFRKVWVTIGTPNLVVIAHYRMGFELISGFLPKRVVAYDIFTNGLDITLRQAPALLRGLLKVLLRLRAAGVVNWMLARVARKSPVVQWGLLEGMRVTGTHSAFGFLQAFRKFETADVSASITQDVLLLAGSEDHYIPIEQWYAQTRMLTNARSITARLFTRGESAQNHCQLGNQGLALKTIVNWLDETPLGDASPGSLGLAGVA